jgi:hypothetical protein
VGKAASWGHGHDRVSRDDFGTGEWGHVVLPGGGFMLPHLLKVTLDTEATKDEEAAPWRSTPSSWNSFALCMGAVSIWDGFC